MNKKRLQNILQRNVDFYHTLLDELGTNLTNPEHQLQAIQTTRQILEIDKNLTKLGKMGEYALYFLIEIDKELKAFELLYKNPDPTKHAGQIHEFYTMLSEYAEAGYIYLNLIKV